MGGMGGFGRTPPPPGAEEKETCCNCCFPPGSRGVAGELGSPSGMSHVHFSKIGDIVLTPPKVAFCHLEAASLAEVHCSYLKGGKKSHYK